MTTTRMTLVPRHDNVHEPLPYTVMIENGIVIAGMPGEDGARLIGFGPDKDEDGIYHLEVLPERAIDNPELVEGMIASYTRLGMPFAWRVPIKKLIVEMT